MSKQTVWVRVLCLLFIVALLLPMVVACKDGNELEPNEIVVTWHMGKITSGLHTTNPEVILDGEENYSYTDVIHIEKKGTTLTFYDYNSEDMPDTKRAEENVYVLSHWVKENGQWVLDSPGDNYEGGTSGRSMEIATSKKGEYVKYTYTSTYDNEDVRLCYRSGQTEKNTEDFVFAKVYLEDLGQIGTLEKNAEYKEKLERKDLIEEIKKDGYYNELEDLTVLTLGDSYFDDPAVLNNLWIDLMADKYNITLYNHGISGSTVTNNQKQMVSKDGISASNPMCERLTDPAAQKSLADLVIEPDIIFFDGGRNDFTRDVPLGTLYEWNDPSRGLNMDTTCFYGAVNYCIAKLKEKYPNALIIGITVWGHEQTNNVTGHTQYDFGNAMIAACKANGIPCFNGMDEEVTGVHMDDPWFRAMYCKSATDISHLNADGMKNFLPVMEKFTSEEYKKFLEAKTAQ